MKRNIFRTIGRALAAAVVAAGLFGCSDLAGTGDEGSAATGELRNVTVRVPDYAKLSEQAVSGSRAIAPQTASVKLSSTASPAAFTAITKSLSDGEGTYEDGDTDKVAATSYKFSFRIPVGTYAAGSLKVELLDSSENVLSAGTNTASIELTAAGANGSFKAAPSIEEGTDNLSGSLAADEMKFAEVTLAAGSSYTVTVTGGVSLYVFDSDGKLLNTDDIPAPFTGSTIENSTDAAVTYYIGIYSASAVESYSVSVSEVVTAVDVTWDFSATTKPTMSKSAEFTETTDTLQKATGYVKGTSGTIFLYVDASSGKLSTSGRTSDAQFNSGTKIQIPVSAGSVVTADVHSTAYELGGVAATAAKTTYTATKAGYVVLKATGSNYLNSIAVTGLSASNDFTADVVSFEAGTAEITNGADTLGLTATSGNVTSSDTDVLTVESVTTDKITVKAGTKAGNVTVTAGDGANTATIAVTVGDYGAVTIGTIEPYSASTVLSSVEWDMDGTNSLAFYSDAACTTALTSTTLQSTSGTGYVVGTSSKAPLYVDATSGKFAYTSGSYAQVNANTKIYVPVSANSEVTVTMHSNNSAYKFVTVGSNSIAMTADSDTFTAAADGYLLVALSSDASGAYMLGITATNVDTATDRTAGSSVAVSVPAVESITVKTAPTATSYEKDAEIDLTGLVITATYSDNTSADITYSSTSGITATGFDSSATGDSITKTITVTYAEQTATFDYKYTVTEAATVTYFSSLRFDDSAFETALGSTPTANGTTEIAKNTEISATDGTWTIEANSGGKLYIQDGTKAITDGSYSTYDYDESAGTGKKYTRLLDTNSKAVSIKLKTGTGTVYLRVDAAPQTSGTAVSLTFAGATTVTWTPSYSGTKYVEIVGDTDGYVTVTTTTTRAYIYGIFAVSESDVEDTGTVTASTSSTDAVYNKPTVSVATSFTQGDTITATAEVEAPTVSTATTVYADGTASTTDGTETVDTSSIVWKLGETELGTGASLSYATSSTSSDTNYLAAGDYSLTASYTAGGTTYTSDAAEVTIIAYGATTYTVTFNSNGGSSVDSQTVASGGTATEPDDPTYSGYTFGGWYSDSGLTTAYDFTTEVTADITLYAKWTKITSVTVTYTGTSSSASFSDETILKDASGKAHHKTGISVEYDGTTYTTGYKMESSSSMTLTLSAAADLYFVANGDKSLKYSATIDGTEVSGTWSVNSKIEKVAAGTYTLTNGSGNKQTSVCAVVITYK